VFLWARPTCRCSFFLSPHNCACRFHRFFLSVFNSLKVIGRDLWGSIVRLFHGWLVIFLAGPILINFFVRMVATGVILWTPIRAFFQNHSNTGLSFVCGTAYELNGLGVWGFLISSSHTSCSGLPYFGFKPPLPFRYFGRYLRHFFRIPWIMPRFSQVEILVRVVFLLGGNVHIFLEFRFGKTLDLMVVYPIR